jgi:hypothetical protein
LNVILLHDILLNIILLHDILLNDREVRERAATPKDDGPSSSRALELRGLHRNPATPAPTKLRFVGST